MESEESSGPFCTNCGQRNLPQARFCARCGTALAERAAEAPTPVTPTPPSPPAPTPSAQAAPAQPTSQPPSDHAVPAAVVYADFAVRLGAWFIDLVIIVAIALALAFWSDAVGIADSESALNTPVNLAFLASPWLYYWLFTGLRGQTPGKMVTGIMVVDERGNVPGLGSAALREVLGKTVSTVVLFIGFLSIAWDDKKQGWHDKIATTYVVRRSRQP